MGVRTLPATHPIPCPPSDAVLSLSTYRARRVTVGTRGRKGSAANLVLAADSSAPAGQALPGPQAILAFL